jgi:hypothetical protein
MKLYHMVLVAVAAMLVVAPAALAGEKEGKGAKTLTLTGEVTKLEGNTMTVSVKKGERAAAEEKAIEVSKDTKILIETDQMESVKGEGGKTRERPKIAEGTAANLKVGQRVNVGYTEDAGKAVAVKILILRPPAAKTGGEKKEGDRGPEPAPRNPGREGDRGPEPAPRNPGREGDRGPEPAPRNPDREGDRGPEPAPRNPGREGGERG